MTQVLEDSTALETSRFRVGGMDCKACGAKIETAIRRLPGVKEVSIFSGTGAMSVTHEGVVDPKDIIGKVKSLGYSAEAVSKLKAAPAERSRDNEHRDAEVMALHGHDHGAESGPWWKSSKARLTLFCGLALAAAFLLGQIAPATKSWTFIFAVAVGLFPIARRAIAGALAGIPFTIETLMTVAAIGAILIGATEEAAAVVFLFLIGELLENVAAGRARDSIQALAKLIPQTALIEREEKTEEVAAASLEPGAIILIRPGDRIAADGVIVDGESAIDEASVTGESMPKRKTVGDAVFAGTINADGVLRAKVTAAAADNTIARIIKQVEEAQESKAPTERFIDRFSRYYTPAVMVLAALVAIIPPLAFNGSWNEWIYKGLAILLIGCPCALVISVPAAIAASLSAGARRGLLLKGGAALKRAGTITTVAFDKTGTLTEGKPKVTDVIAFGHTEAEIIALGAALEIGSSHPLGLGILAKASADGVIIPASADASALGGEGVTGRVGDVMVFLGSPTAAAKRTTLTPEQEATITALNEDGKTVSVLLTGDVVAGLIALRDEPREDAKAGIAALSTLGIKTLMLTGDNARTARAIAAGLGLEARADLLPEDKQRIVRELQSTGERVAKVGDGINDAPALAAANIGIAMGGGTDVALETADAAILHGRVGDVARLVMLSRRTMASIRQNITIALGLKAVFLVTTIAGLTGLWPAILADTGATVLVTMNALRLLRADTSSV